MLQYVIIRPYIGEVIQLVEALSSEEYMIHRAQSCKVLDAIYFVDCKLLWTKCLCSKFIC